MATTFKTFLNDDRAATRTLLHEAIPITGSIVFGTYPEPGLTNTNIKEYTHGMFQSVYDYSYTKSSANHIFDLTVGYASDTSLTVTADTYKTKKQMIYNEFAKILVGHDTNGAIRQFDEDGDLTLGDKYKECFVISIARLLNKDEIKKGSFYMDIDVSGVIPPATCSVGGYDGAVKADALFGGKAALDADSGTTLIITNTDGTTVTFTTDATKTETQSTALLIGTSSVNTDAKAAQSLHVAFTAAIAAGTLKSTLTPSTYGSETSITLSQVAGTSGNKTIAGTLDTGSLDIDSVAFSTGVSAFAGGTNGSRAELRISDTGAGTGFRTNSPVGEYGILKCDTYKVLPQNADCTDAAATCEIVYEDDADAALHKAGSNTKDLDRKVGLIFYQAGVVVLSPFMFERYLNTSTDEGYDPTGTNAGKLPIGHTDGDCNVARPILANISTVDYPVDTLLNSQSLDAAATALRKRINKMAFNNTTELNSTIYFCRASHNDFNYSSNPTYTGPDAGTGTGSSKIRVKENQTDAPVSYITTVGLYSADNELLAVAKLSEPLRKDPTNEMVLRVRLDY